MSTEKLARLRAAISLDQPDSRDLAAALVHCALASGRKKRGFSSVHHRLARRFAV
jgi:hypothetical protein